MLTFGELKTLVAPYAGRAGKCANASEVGLFARSVLQHLLFEGAEPGIRKVCLIAEAGCFSLPSEVETVLKVRIDRRVGNVLSKWIDYHTVNESFDGQECIPSGQILAEDGELSPLAYSLPPTGSRIGVMGSCNEAEDAFVLVQGKDVTGRHIYTTFRGEQIPGEKFQISHGQIRYGEVTWGQITGITKPKTNGYVQLYAVNLETGERKFLADWSPVEEKPLYRRFRITHRSCPPFAHISMLCRIKLKDSYHDNEIIFFDNILAVKLAAQRFSAEENNDVQTANYKASAVTNSLEKEGAYKRTNSGPIEVFQALSGGAIKNIVGGRIF